MFCVCMNDCLNESTEDWYNVPCSDETRIEQSDIKSNCRVLRILTIEYNTRKPSLYQSGTVGESNFGVDFTCVYLSLVVFDSLEDLYNSMWTHFA